MDVKPLKDLLGSTHLGAVVTLKRSGRPQLSMVGYTFDPEADRIMVSVTDSRAKTANLRRDPRVSFMATGNGGWSYAIAEGTASLSPVAQAPDDAAVDQLVEIYRGISGEHPDWDDFRRAMVADQRLVLTIEIDRYYGSVR